MTNWIGVDLRKNTSLADTGKDDRCGTHAGYQAHNIRRDIICIECREAATVYSRDMSDYQRNYGVQHSGRNKVNRRKRYIENREKVIVSVRAYQHANYERMRAVQKKRYDENREKIIASVLVYKRANPEKIKQLKSRRRARKLGNGHSPYTEAQVLEKYGTDCHICLLPIDMNAPRQVGKEGWQLGLHIDHLIALANGGRDDLENARPSHGLCNVSKGAK